MWWAHLAGVVVAPRAVVNAAMSSATPGQPQLPPPVTSRFNEFDIVCQDPLTVYDPRAPAATESLGAPGIKVVKLPTIRAMRTTIVGGESDGWKL